MRYNRQKSHLEEKRELRGYLEELDCYDREENVWEYVEKSCIIFPEHFSFWDIQLFVHQILYLGKIPSLWGIFFALILYYVKVATY